MPRPLIAAILAVLAAGTARAQELGPQVLQKLKAATVFVKAGSGTGSGVLFKKTGTTGWVLTCEHVTGGASTVFLTFWPGTAQEKTVSARVTGADPYWDLACCEVKDMKELPEPLALGTRTEIKEGAAAFVAGFPFGAGLAMGSKRPEITITVAKVASIMRDDDGSVGLVHLEGEVNPGNSGGPVVDAGGKVIGIAAAKIAGTQTAFAVPGESTKQFLLGTALSIGFSRGREPTTTNVKYEVQVRLADPMGTMKSAGIAYGRRRKVEDTTEPKENGSWRKVSASLKETSLKIDDKTGTAKGVIELSRTIMDPPEDKVVYQVYWVQSDGTKVWSEPNLTSMYFESAPSDRNLPRPPRLDSSMKLPATDVAALPRLAPSAQLELRAVISDLAISKDGRKLLALDLGRGRLLRISTDPLVIEATLDVGENAAALVVSRDWTFVAVVSRVAVLPANMNDRASIEGKVQVIDAAGMTVKSSFPIPVDPADAVVNDAGALYVSGPAGTALVDIGTGAVVRKSADPGRSSFLRFHPDQGRLYIGEVQSLHHRCLPPVIRLDGKRADHHGPSSGDFPMGGDFEISPDGTRLVTMFGGVVSLSRAAVLDMMPETTIVPWTSFAFSAKSAFGASADGTLRQYAGKNFETRKTWSLGRRLHHLAVDPSGRVLYGIASEIPAQESPEQLSLALRERQLPHGDLVVIPLPE